MTKSRTPSTLLSLTIGIALSAIAMPAAAGEPWNSHFDRIEDALKDKLPEAPKLTTPPAPNAESNRSRPPMVTMTWGSKMPVFKKPATPPASLKSLKSK